MGFTFLPEMREGKFKVMGGRTANPPAGELTAIEPQSHRMEVSAAL